MTADDPTPDAHDHVGDVDRAGLVDLLASLRADGVPPEPDDLRRAEELRVTEEEVERRAGSMGALRRDVAQLSAGDESIVAADELGTRRSVQHALDSALPGTGVARARPGRARRIPAPVVAIAAATVLVAGVGLGGWIVAQEGSDQLASVADEAADSGGREQEVPAAAGESAPALPPQLPVVGTATSPDGAIELAERHWSTARTSSGDESSGFAQGDDTTPAPDAADGLAASEDGAASDAEVCGIASDAVIVVIDDAPHLVVRTADGALVVVRVVDCLEVARA